MSVHQVSRQAIWNKTHTVRYVIVDLHTVRYVIVDLHTIRYVIVYLDTVRYVIVPWRPVCVLFANLPTY